MTKEEHYEDPDYSICKDIGCPHLLTFTDRHPYGDTFAEETRSECLGGLPQGPFNEEE